MPRFPPGPPSLAAYRGLFGGGDMAHLPRFFAATAERYGPIASWRMAARRFYLVTEPVLIEELLVERGGAFRKSRGVQRLERLLGQGLLTANGAFHLRQRRLVQPAFHRERIAAYAAAMVRRAARFADGLVPGATVDVDRAMHRLTLGIAAETLFGADVDADAQAIGEALDDAMAGFPAALMPWGELLDHLPMVPVVARFRRARAVLDAIVYRLIAEKRRALAAGTAGEDALTTLVAATGADAMPEAQLRDEAMTLFLAGHETTANALTWTWWLLATHPGAAARLDAELRTVLGGRDPDAADLPRLTFTRDVVAEAMRLYPPAWVVGRQAIVGTTLGGWPIARGSVVIAPQLLVQRDPRWWPQPLAFRPERWSSGETDGLPKFAYAPFGGGNRICIGEGFAWTELVLVVATIARRVRFSAPPGLGDVPIAPVVTLRPKIAVPLVAASPSAVGS